MALSGLLWIFVWMDPIGTGCWWRKSYHKIARQGEGEYVLRGTMQKLPKDWSLQAGSARSAQPRILIACQIYTTSTYNTQDNADHCCAVAAVSNKGYRVVHTPDETQGPLGDFLNTCLEATIVSIHPFAAEWPHCCCSDRVATNQCVNCMRGATEGVLWIAICCL